MKTTLNGTVLHCFYCTALGRCKHTNHPGVGICGQLLGLKCEDYVPGGIYGTDVEFNMKNIQDVKFDLGLDQSAKADAGKPRLSLVPRQIITDIARVREYGNSKYGDPNNWKTVEKDRYKDAAFRHFMAYLDNPNGVDEESGLPHLSHLACNIAFLCELEKTND